MDLIDNRPLPGGPLSIDLLNTRWSPPGGSVDWLDDDNAVRSFVKGHHRFTSDVDAARRSLVLVRDLVELLFAASGPFGADADLVAEVDDGALGHPDGQVSEVLTEPVEAVADQGIVLDEPVLVHNLALVRPRTSTASSGSR